MKSIFTGRSKRMNQTVVDESIKEDNFGASDFTVEDELDMREVVSHMRLQIERKVSEISELRTKH